MCPDPSVVSFSPAGYFMDHAVRLQDMPIRYSSSTLRGWDGGQGGGGCLWGSLLIIPCPPNAGSSAPARVTVQRPTRAESPGAFIVCTSSPRWDGGSWRGAYRKAADGEGAFGTTLYSQVEMFGVTAAESGAESEMMLDEFLTLQKEIFSELGLHYRSVGVEGGLSLDPVPQIQMGSQWCPHSPPPPHPAVSWICPHRSWDSQRTASLTSKPGCQDGANMGR